jgi:hypothetical protein
LIFLNALPPKFAAAYRGRTTSNTSHSTKNEIPERD